MIGGTLTSPYACSLLRTFCCHPRTPNQAAYHLLLCCYALGDMDGMRIAFQVRVQWGEVARALGP